MPLSPFVLSQAIDLAPSAPIKALTRLEPNASEQSLVPGFRARIADPLWLLGRQWQLGELHGEDAASPVRVEIDLELVPVGLASAGPSGVTVDPAATVEPHVEAQDVEAGPGRIRHAAELGLLARRALLAAQAEAVWTALCAFPDLRLDVAGLEGYVALRLLARRSLDGIALAHRLDALSVVDAAQLAVLTKLPAAGLQGAAAALVAWRAQAAASVVRPVADAWDRERFEHRFALRSADGTLDLPAAEHPGGRLDWYSVDIQTSAALVSTTSTTHTLDTIPIPVQFAGMPARRWWDLEDEAVNLSDVEVGPEDLIRMLTVELMTIFADDWYLVPVRMPVGHVARVRAVRVDDNFAYKQAPRLLPSFAEQDGPERTWRMFELTGQPPLEPEGPGPWLFVAPTVADLQESDPIEEVRFLRDEVSNLGWAVERTVEGRDGRPRRRAEPRVEPPAPRGEAGWAWQFISAVPHGWIPFVPVSTDVDGVGMALRRAQLPGWTDDDFPQATLLSPMVALIIPEEEVPAVGIVVIRTWQRTRGTDGEVLLWQGREKRPGTGEPGAELVFDRLLR